MRHVGHVTNNVTLANLRQSAEVALAFLLSLGISAKHLILLLFLSIGEHVP